MTDFISASILSADFARLGEDCHAVIKAGATSIHFDVMDNHYVPALTFGPIVCEALRRDGLTAPIHVHLMVTGSIQTLITQFAKSGATSLTLHPDIFDPIHTIQDSLNLIHDLNCQVGLAINPNHSHAYLKTLFNMLYKTHLLSKINLLLIMSVNPGLAGQAFIPASLEKIKTARALINHFNPSILLSVDGGINLTNIQSIQQAGANHFVIGSGIFNSSYQKNYEKIIQEYKLLLNYNYYYY